MKGERAALLLLTMVFLATLTLGYSTLPYAGPEGGLTRSLLDALFSDRPGEEGRPSSGGVFSFRAGFPNSDFTFKPSNIHVDCPVAVLPDDPMLVCTDGPAKSLPVLPNREPENMVVWYDGVYYVPRVYSQRGVTMLKGINPAPFTVDTDRPLVLMTYLRSASLEFRENSPGGTVSVFSALPVEEESVEEENGYRIHRYSLGPVDRSMRPGYYPFFVTVNSTNGTVALLMWVALLEKPIVEITDYPAVVGGDGSIWVTVRGTVRYPDGSPVDGGVVWITLNETKGKAGIFLGQSTVRNGRFEVKGFIGPGQPPGSYHVIAYYRGYMAYPSNSDPLMVIRRKPEVSARLENGTLRLSLYWRDVPLANEAVTLSVGSEVLTLKTDDEGYVTLNLTQENVTSIRVMYGGSAYYLPINETVQLAVGDGPSTKAEGPSLLERLLGLLKAFAGIFRVLFPLLAVIAIAGAGYSVYSKKRAELRLVPQLKLSVGRVEFLKPSRRVFLPGEAVKVSLSDEAELFLDGESLGFGREFTLELGEGRHVLSAGGQEIELYVLPPREAVIKAYELHFLPFASSNGVPERPMTPIEIEHLLEERGLDGKPLRGITRVFVRARYSEHPVGKDDFIALLEELRELGVVE
ncbi:DUF4129 domain-containing protein [Thermococcus sp. MV11]|uniref:DUF4129 domain-containing protein n=1 Tax=Thermococcus sp. MV11 TaxID=1638267 RepID=UPI001431096E|nr:DUF4129 domain-containing protein [Thermococcus sp. MV11]NJE04486.1 hypothetical protein [Thermococcus sp. MV11]